MVKFFPPQGQIHPIQAFSALSRWAIFSAIRACMDSFLFELPELELEELEELETTFTACMAGRSYQVHGGAVASIAQLRADLNWIDGIYQHPGSEASHHLDQCSLSPCA